MAWRPDTYALYMTDSENGAGSAASGAASPASRTSLATGIGRLADLRSRHVPIVMLTAYDYPSARIAELGGADIILVGDSAAMTVLGYSSTREISADELIMLARAARRGAHDTLILGDLPFGTYETSDAQALGTARRFMREAGCDAVKLEGAGPLLSRVRAIVADGIPVVGHVGLLPQSVTNARDYRAKGRDAEQALAIIHDAVELEIAGCSALVIEAVPAQIAGIITRRVHIPVIGIGAGASASGQVLVYHDLLGFTEGRVPRFVKPYATARDTLVHAVQEWSADVRARRFPSVEHTYPIADDVLADVMARLEAPHSNSKLDT